jgi:hypothetical protein
VARIDGGMAEAEAAGRSPRKKPHGSSPRKKPSGEETFLLHLDWAKHDSRTEPIELDDNPDDRADGGKGLPKKTKAPPITQEDDGGDDLYSEEEEASSEDDEGREDGVAARDDATCASIPARPRRGCRSRRRDARPSRLVLAGPSATAADDRTDGGRQDKGAARDEATRASIPARPHGAKSDGGADDRTDGGRQNSVAARDDTTCASIPARPRGTKRDGGADDWTDDDDEELDAARDEARRRSISARTRGATRDGGANNQADGGRPRIPKTTGNLDGDDKDLDEDVAVRARAALAWEPRGHSPSNVVRPDKPYDVAARALSALRDDKPYRNPRFVQDHGMEGGEEANSKANPPSVDGGVWVGDDARGGQS